MVDIQCDRVSQHGGPPITAPSHTGPSTFWRRAFAPAGLLYAVVTLALAAGLGAWLLSVPGMVSIPSAAGAAVAGHGVAALAAITAFLRARRASTGISSRVWRLLAYGLVSWAMGCAAYVVFLLTGGDPRSPATWTQVGFLAAYPFWYRALWLIRQPVVARSRRHRLETALVEATTLGLMAAVTGGALWSDYLSPAQNIVLIIPPALDLLLVAGVYSAVRRSRLTRASAHAWFAAAFGCLALTDIAVNVLVPRGYFEAAGLALGGYAVTMGCLVTAACRPIQLTETLSGLGRSTATVGVVGLALVAPAAVLLRSPVGYLAIIPGLALAVWLCLRITVAARGDADALTGWLTPDAVERHLAGALAVARDGRPAALIVADIRGFAAWTSERGCAAGDSMVANVSDRLRELHLREGGLWARLGPARFAWLGLVPDVAAARDDGSAIARVASAASGLDVQAAVVMLPEDAQTPPDALAAAGEAIEAARQGARQLVAFDRGYLDGVEAGPGYAESLLHRRSRIQQIIADPAALEAAFQPIVSLEHGSIRGYEALARFNVEPRQGPDKWIAEAHSVGMGVELEAECLRRAFERRTEAPIGTYVSLNASPHLLLSDRLDQVLGGADLNGVLFEITEHDHVDDYVELADRLALLRGRGARVAIDDVGAGHSSMRHVLNLRPDVVKLDRWLVDGVNLDSAKRALIRSFVALCAELQADLVMEGVETHDELAVLRELGASFAQGWLFARPAPNFLTTEQVPAEVFASPAGRLELSPASR